MLLPELQKIVMEYKREFERFPQRLVQVKRRVYDIYQQACALEGMFNSHFGIDRFPPHIREGMAQASSVCRDAALVTFELITREPVLSDVVMDSILREEMFVENARQCPERWVSRICDVAVLESLIYFTPELTTLEDVPTIEFKNS